MVWCGLRVEQHCYRFGAELRGEDLAYGGEQQRVELLVEAEEVAEAEDDHLPGVSVQPLPDLHQNRLQTHIAQSE